MEEKILIKSERYNVKKLFKVMCIIGVILTVIFSLIIISNSIDYYDWQVNNHEHDKYCYKSEYLDDYYDDYYTSGLIEDKMDCVTAEYEDAVSYAFINFFIYGWVSILCLIVVPLALVGLLIRLCLCSYELTVSDKRVFGRVLFFKRVSLPVDLISATSRFFLKGVAVSTASGIIRFVFIKNADKINTEINNLLIYRQQEKNKAITVPIENEIDKLKKYKDLLDSGVITQEEFDDKKKQLLGL